MTFGLRNASQSFQRYIYRALGNLNFVFYYIDDILISSSNSKEHENHLRAFLKSEKICPTYKRQQMPVWPVEA